MNTLCWGQGLIETYDQDDMVILGPVTYAMAESDGRNERPNSKQDKLQSKEDSRSGSKKASKTSSFDESNLTTSTMYDVVEPSSYNQLNLTTTMTYNVIPTNSFSSLTIHTGIGHDLVGMEETAVSATALVQLWNGNDDFLLTDNNYFYGTLTAQGGIGTDSLFDAPTNFYSNAPTFMGFE
jgi:hypothetical protein